MALRLIKEDDSITLSISTSKIEGNVEATTTSAIKLDEEDVMDLIADLSIWLEVKSALADFDKNQSYEEMELELDKAFDELLDKLDREEKIKEMNEKAMKDAYEQSQSKLELEKRLREVFIESFDADLIEKQAIDAAIENILKYINRK